MFEKYVQLLETLKDQQFSVRLRKARQTILDTLNSDAFSLNVHPYLRNMNLVGEPFTDFYTNPEQISQIKKIINALYHAELALKDVESVTLRAGIQLLIDVPKSLGLSIYRKSIHHIYQASFLITHLDIDLFDIFSQELAVLNPLLILFHAHAEKYSEETRGFLLQIGSSDVPRKIGVVAGVGIDQLDTRGGEVDYEYLIGVSGVLSGYLDQFNGYLTRFSSNVSECEPNLDKKKLQELQDDALQLLNAFKGTQSSSWVLPLKTLHYIHIIRHTITLSMSIVEQLGLLNESSQDAARAKLATLKYELLPMLLGLTDKIEENAMLAPGMVSKPLKAKISRMYQVLIEYTVRYVEFSQKGQSLVTLEDSQFVAARLEYTYQRLAEHKKVLLMVDVAKAASIDFFALLSRPENRYLRIVDLPKGCRELLATHYKLMQPYVLQFDIALSNAIIGGLTRSKEAIEPRRMINFSSDMYKIREILLLKPILDAWLAKAGQSREFRATLSSNIIASISENIEDLKLFPHNISEDPFSINEANMLRLEAVAEYHQLSHEPQPFTASKALMAATIEENILRFVVASQHEQIVNLDSLTSAQALSCYQFYQIKCEKLERAQQAYNEFHRILIQEAHPPFLNGNHDDLKKKLRHLYRIFQSYLVCGFMDRSSVLILHWSQYFPLMRGYGGALPLRVSGYMSGALSLLM